jgi:type II secretory pathway pseudopilin PulG
MQNRGTPPTSEDLDTIATKEYIESLTTDSIPQGTVDSLITTGLSGYVSRSYVDAQDALNATEAYVDAGDDTRLKLADVSTSSGIAGLDSAGKVAVARVPAASTQRWPKPFYTPSSYNSVTKTATSTETTVYTIPVADPGFNYKLLVSGIAQGFTAVDGQGPIVRVRVGSTSGAIVAMGYGAPEQYIWGDDDFDRTGPNLGGGWEETYIDHPDGGHVETNGSSAVWVRGTPSYTRRKFS